MITGMNLEDILLCEISQPQKPKSYPIPLIWVIRVVEFMGHQLGGWSPVMGVGDGQSTGMGAHYWAVRVSVLQEGFCVVWCGWGHPIWCVPLRAPDCTPKMVKVVNLHGYFATILKGVGGKRTLESQKTRLSSHLATVKLGETEVASPRLSIFISEGIPNIALCLSSTSTFA